MIEARGRVRLFAAVTMVAGVVALFVTFAFQALPEVKAASACAQPNAVLRFELARTQADLDSIFGAPGSACRSKAVAAVDAVNDLDVLAYIPAYTTFAVFAALFLAAGRRGWAVYGAVAAGVLALICDYVETFGLLAMTPDLTPPAALLARVSTAAAAKFVALGVNGVFLAALCFMSVPKRRILGGLLCLPILGVTMMLIDIQWALVQTLAFLASWTPLMLIAGRAAISGRS